jgi:hypothetical protein
MEIKYNLNIYTKEDAYHLVDTLFNELYSYKKWNNEKDKMLFLFTSQGADIRGDVKINENELIIKGMVHPKKIYLSDSIESCLIDDLNKVFVN